MSEEPDAMDERRVVESHAHLDARAEDARMVLDPERAAHAHGGLIEPAAA